MCKFCDKDEIKDIEEYAKIYSQERINRIVYDKNTNQYHIWIECEDSYYSGKEIWNIQFCPKCGKKLK